MDTEKKFWELVNEIGWGTKTTDYNEIRHNLKDNYSTLYVVTMKSFGIKKRKELVVIMNNHAILKTGKLDAYWETGDDGFWDLTAHIVGLGEEMYNLIIRRPILAKSIKYKENFEYCFNIDIEKTKNVGNKLPAAN